eukprot:g14084.t1
MAQSYLFVTVGTTKFEKLVDHVCSYPFLQATFDSGVKAVVCQTGNGRLPAEVAAVARRPASRAGGAGRRCYEALVVNATAVLSHAGAGSILTALRWGKRLCVVVNDDLMGNHQLELAQAMAEGGYLWMVEGLREVVDDVVADVQEFHGEDEEEQDKITDDEAVEDVEVDDVGFIENTESSEVLQWSLPAQIRRTLKGAVEDDPRTRMKQYPKADRTGFHRLIAQEVGLIGFAPAGAPSSIQHESRRCSVM